MEAAYLSMSDFLRLALLRLRAGLGDECELNEVGDLGFLSPLNKSGTPLVGAKNAMLLVRPYCFDLEDDLGWLIAFSW